jgi:hypothetical protein
MRPLLAVSSLGTSALLLKATEDLLSIHQGLRSRKRSRWARARG